MNERTGIVKILPRPFVLLLVFGVFAHSAASAAPGNESELALIFLSLADDNVTQLRRLIGSAAVPDLFAVIDANRIGDDGEPDVDLRRPVGLAVSRNENRFDFVFLLPISDDERIRRLLSARYPRQGRVSAALHLLEADGREPVYLKTSGSWGVLGTRRERVESYTVSPLANPKNDLSVFLHLDRMRAAGGLDPGELWRGAILERMLESSAGGFRGSSARAKLYQLAFEVGEFFDDVRGARIVVDLPEKNGSVVSVTCDAAVLPGSGFSDIVQTLRRGPGVPAEGRSAGSEILAIHSDANPLTEKAADFVVATVQEFVHAVHDNRFHTDVERTKEWTRSWRALSGILRTLRDQLHGGSVDLHVARRTGAEREPAIVVSLRSSGLDGAAALSWLNEHIETLYVPLGVLDGSSLVRRTVSGAELFTARVGPQGREWFAKLGLRPELRLGVGRTEICLVAGAAKDREIEALLFGRRTPREAPLRLVTGTRGKVVTGSDRVRLDLEPIAGGVRVRGSAGFETAREFAKHLVEILLTTR